MAAVKTKVVVFHADNEPERDRIQEALKVCLKEMGLDTTILISRACAVLYEDILGDWREWRPTTPIRYPEKVDPLVSEKLKTSIDYLDEIESTVKEQIEKARIFLQLAA